MKVPVSWLKDYVEIDLPIEELARLLTNAGLEVEEIHYVGLPMPEAGAAGARETKITGLGWDPEKIVVGSISEVMPHPNADRLVLCRLDDGQQEHIVLTGAPNLFEYKGKGPLEKPLKVAYAREGARLYDGHQPGNVLMTLKRTKIRGVESYSMVCSEKELGISEEHEGILFLEDDAPTGQALADTMGDAVLEIAITPNLVRDANVLGVAREVAALTGKPLWQPRFEVQSGEKSIAGQVKIEIREPELNPRFVAGLIENVQVGPSPLEVQRRLRLAGMRPINNIVDATNYVMLAIGQPLHAFDYDVLRQRAGGTPTIITRRATQGETLTTLDKVDRRLDDITVLVTDTAGPLSIAGIMGGTESEVSDSTRTVLLEGAAWNYINIRRTVNAQRLPSEAAYRFSRGIHPAMAERGVLLGLELMRHWSGGEVYAGLVDEYPMPPGDTTLTVTPADVQRWLGIRLEADEIADILQRLEFQVESQNGVVIATAPDHRLDIGVGVVGLADLMEEIARIYGYDRIPENRMADTLPPQFGNPELDREERVRDLLVNLGLQEVMSYRMTTPEREKRLLVDPAQEIGALEAVYGAAQTPDNPYIRLANPIASDRTVMRRSLLAAVLEVIERNARLFSRQAIFEVGPVFLPVSGSALPEEPARLAIAMIGPLSESGWQKDGDELLGFYDLKGAVQGLLEALHIPEVSYQPGEHPAMHPGKCALVRLGEKVIGALGELHPQVTRRYELHSGQSNPLLAAELDLSAILAAMPARYNIRPVPAFPPVLEDLAVVVPESVPAARVEQALREAGGNLVAAVRLFDVYRGEQIGREYKSLAYSLTFQAPDRTLTDQDVTTVRQRIIRRLEQELGAKIRS